jgi:hypothetical protein
MSGELLDQLVNYGLFKKGYISELANSRRADRF